MNTRRIYRENLYSLNKLKVGCASKGVTKLCVRRLKPLYKVATFGDQTSGCLLKVGWLIVMMLASMLEL